MDDNSFNYNRPGGSSQPPNRSIDVTRPRDTSSGQTSSANIDTSRVSAYTLREQQALERLKRQVGAGGGRGEKNSHIKTIIAVILVLILLAIAVVFVIVVSKNSSMEEGDYDVRMSMQIENKSALSIITDAGKEQLRSINPGDQLPLSAYVRNSNSYKGDINANGSPTPPSIFVRFKLVLILDYEERYDILKPTLSDLWYKYNAEDEASMSEGISQDDHYYYYLGSLVFMQQAQLFSQLTFDGEALTVEDGGKYGQIQVIVEVIEANLNNLTSDLVWATAPKYWIMQMILRS